MEASSTLRRITQNIKSTDIYQNWSFTSCSWNDLGMTILRGRGIDLVAAGEVVKIGSP